MPQLAPFQAHIRRHDQHVVLLSNGLGLGMRWQAGIDVYHAIERLAKFSQAYEQHKDHAQVQADHETIGTLTIHRLGLEFTFELQGKIWFQCPWTAAVQISKGIYLHAKKIEESEPKTAERIIADQALLLRTGLPVGLSDHPLIQKEAWKAAEDVHIPGGIEPTSKVGAPRLIQDPPPREHPGIIVGV